jgi:S1-C subfamily serine protease
MTCLRTLPWHVAALLLATGAARADAPQPAARADAPPPIALGLSVLKVEARRAQGGFSLGSAVVVAPGELVTNCHVTRDATLLQVLYIGQRWTVKSQVVDIPHDLCLLRVPGLPAQAVALHDSLSLKPGHPVFAVGYTGGMALQASQGEVVALHRMDGGQVARQVVHQAGGQGHCWVSGGWRAAAGNPSGSGPAAATPAVSCGGRGGRRNPGCRSVGCCQ